MGSPDYQWGAEQARNGRDIWSGNMNEAQNAGYRDERNRQQFEQQQRQQWAAAEERERSERARRSADAYRYEAPASPTWHAEPGARNTGGGAACAAPASEYTVRPPPVEQLSHEESEQLADAGRHGVPLCVRVLSRLRQEAYLRGRAEFIAELNLGFWSRLGTMRYLRDARFYAPFTVRRTYDPLEAMMRGYCAGYALRTYTLRDGERFCVEAGQRLRWAEVEYATELGRWRSKGFLRRLFTPRPRPSDDVRHARHFVQVHLRYQ